MSYDSVAALRAAGHPIDVLSDGQRGVLAAAGGGEVEGQHVFIIL